MTPEKYRAMLNGIREQVIVDISTLLKKCGATVIQLNGSVFYTEDLDIKEVDIKKRKIVVTDDNGNSLPASFGDLTTTDLISILEQIEADEFEIITELSEE
jgi:hypothetical protein